MESEIREIVVGVGEVEEVDAHLARAIALAEALGATLHVVHAYRLPDPVYYPYGGASALDPEILHALAETARSRLEARVREHAGGGLIRCRAVPVPADVAVLDVAEEVGADLVMVGASRGGRIARAILGTTAQRIVRAARAPVLVVRRPEHRPPGRVLLTTDLSELSAAVHARALELVAAIEAAPELRSLLVVDHDVPLPPPLKERVARETGAAQLAAFLERLRPGGPAVEGAVRLGDPAREILAEAAEWEADLLVLGTHGRSGTSRFLIGSVAERVAREARCDLLVIPTAALSPPAGPRPSRRSG